MNMGKEASLETVFAYFSLAEINTDEKPVQTARHTGLNGLTISLTEPGSTEEPEGGTRILLLTAHTLWGNALGCMLQTFKRKIGLSLAIIEEESLAATLAYITAQSYSLVVITAPGFVGAELSLVKALRAAGADSNLPILLVCSRYSLPTLNELLRNQVQGIISSSASADELETALEETLGGEINNLKRQYLRAVRNLTHQPLQDYLTEYEKRILRLVAADLPDQLIAERLGLNVRTVNNQLRIIYAKLGTRGRAGAVGSAFVNGILTPHDVLTARELIVHNDSD